MPLCSLIVLALKHFEGTLDLDNLISSYLLCKTRWSIRKHIKEMSLSRARSNNVVKVTSSRKRSEVIRSRTGEVKLLLVVFPDVPEAASRPPAAARLRVRSAIRPAPPSGQTHLQHAELAQGLMTMTQLITSCFFNNNLRLLNLQPDSRSVPAVASRGHSSQSRDS